jgi:hypothetical protein
MKDAAYTAVPNNMERDIEFRWNFTGTARKKYRPVGHEAV